jgi:malic enzyme
VAAEIVNPKDGLDEDVIDPAFALHRGGKMAVQATVPVRDREDLSLAYTPGVAKVCSAIAEQPELVHDYTWKSQVVAVVTDGSAVLGLGDVGPEAALPVMEGKALPELRVVVSGVGAAGVACARMLLAAGVRDLVGVDTAGALYRGRRARMNPVKEELAHSTNPYGRRGPLSEVIAGADFFLGVSHGDVLTAADVRRMARDPIVFALANPTPEIAPEEATPHARVVATGRSDYPNQINNVLAFPGLFRGALDVRAADVNDEMKLAAAGALAALVGPDELTPEHIVPSVFDRRVAPAVARAVAQAAERTGVARRARSPGSDR